MHFNDIEFSYVPISGNCINKKQANMLPMLAVY